MKTRHIHLMGLAILSASVAFGCGKGDTIGECHSDYDCADALQQKCVASRCVLRVDPECDDGYFTEDNGETDVDCGGYTCNKCMDTKICKQALDCMSGMCVNGRCATVGCTTDAECVSSSGVTRHGCGPTGVCMTCSDGIQNGNETGPDCGGSCTPCTDDKGCHNDSDCGSGQCVSGTCRARGCADSSECTPGYMCYQGECVSCTDNRKNGDETGIDCGGSCTPCTAGNKCNIDGDCFNGTCSADKVCVSNVPVDTQTCTNNVKDGSETDVDCGGPACPKCGIERGCNKDSDCLSWECKSGICKGDACAAATPGAILINEVFTNPDSSKDMLHSNSKQMHFIELYNPGDARVEIASMSLNVQDSAGAVKVISGMVGCLSGHSFHVIYPNTQSLEALDGDATKSAVSDLDAALHDNNTYTVTLMSGAAEIDSVSVPMAPEIGISTARKGNADTAFVLHNTIDVPDDKVPAGEAKPQNLYSPGVPNDSGFPQG